MVHGKASFCARLAGILLIAMVFVVATGCGFGVSSDSTSTSCPQPTYAPIVFPTATTSPSAAVIQTVTDFCQAWSDGNLNKAYGYLSPHYKQTVTDPSQLPNLRADFGKITGCMEFSKFPQVSGNHATDHVQYSVTDGSFGTTTIPGTVGLVQSGSVWQIDSIG